MEYFVHRYSENFNGMDKEHLNEQFLNYQLLGSEDIPKSVKGNAGLIVDDPYRVDVLWGYL